MPANGDSPLHPQSPRVYVRKAIQNGCFPVFSYRSHMAKMYDIEQGLLSALQVQEEGPLTQQAAQALCEAGIRHLKEKREQLTEPMDEKDPAKGRWEHPWLAVTVASLVAALAAPVVDLREKIEDLLRELRGMVPEEAAEKHRAWEGIQGLHPTKAAHGTEASPREAWEPDRVFKARLFLVHLIFRKQFLYSRYVATRRAIRLITYFIGAAILGCLGFLGWKFACLDLQCASGRALIVTVAVAGWLGSLTSLLTRLNSGKIRDYDENAYYSFAFGWQELLAGTVVGPVFALFVFALQAGGVVHVIDFGAAGAANPETVFKIAALAFVGGFSERLAPDLIKKLTDKTP